MDKIQAAIAKARAARDAREAETITATGVEHKQKPARLAPPGAEAPKPAPVGEAPQSKVKTLPPIASTTEGVETAWKRLATCAPNARQMARNRIVTFESKAPPAGAVAMDMLRTKVLQQMRANGWTRLAITSPGADCGKSTVTLNLAFSLARQAEQRVIVAEMDMRKPSLARTLGVKGSKGFAEVLHGTVEFADVAIRPRPNVAFGLNHARVRNPAELLQSPSVGPALARIEETYAPTLTIFDLPPMLVSDDALAVIGQVDCVLLIAAAGSTTLKEIDICEGDLAAQTNVMGVVLNKCRYIEREHGYSYGSYD